jgi:hypothetical protein
MPYNTNDPNYQTKNTRVLNFNDFEENIRKEKQDLEKVDRSYIDNDDEIHQLPGNTKKKYNRITHKLDDLSRAEVKDKLQSMDRDGIEDPKHKWKAQIPTQQSSKNESHETTNYMFFSNLKTIHRLSEELLKMDETEMDNILNEHDWAEDHIATCKDDIEEVFNFFRGLKDGEETSTEEISKPEEEISYFSRFRDENK